MACWVSVWCCWISEKSSEAAAAEAEGAAGEGAAAGAGAGEGEAAYRQTGQKNVEIPTVLKNRSVALACLTLFTTYLRSMTQTCNHFPKC